MNYKIASWFSYTSIAQLLLKSGANKDATDTNGVTALILGTLNNRIY